MARDVTPTAHATPAAALERAPSPDGADPGALGRAVGVLGSFYAALAGLAVGGLEAWSDRRAEAGALRARSRAGTARRRPRSARDARL